MFVRDGQRSPEHRQRLIELLREDARLIETSKQEQEEWLPEHVQDEL